MLRIAKTQWRFCIWLVPIWGRFEDSYLGECHRSYDEWWKTRHGDVGGQPGDNNEHCDLRGCASRPIGRFSPPPWTRSRGKSELAGKRVVLPPPSRTIHNARGESPGPDIAARSTLLSATFAIRFDTILFPEHCIFQG